MDLFRTGDAAAAPPDITHEKRPARAAKQLVYLFSYLYAPSVCCPQHVTFERTKLSVGHGAPCDIIVLRHLIGQQLITINYALQFSNQNLWQKVKKNIRPQNELLMALRGSAARAGSFFVRDIWGRVPRAP